MSTSSPASPGPSNEEPAAAPHDRRPARATQLAALLRKECRDTIRDRRGVGAALLYCLVGPLLVAMVAQTLVRQEADPRPPRVALVRGDEAPRLRAHLLAEGFELAPSPAAALAADPRQLLAGGGLDAVVEVPEAAAAAWSEGRPLELRLWADFSKSSTRRQVDRLSVAFAAWDRAAVEARLIARGLAPGVARAVTVDRADVGGSTPRAEALGTMLLIYLLLSPFFASSALAADLVAGERERATLEQLLVQPAPPLLLVAAKWAAAALLGAVGTAAAVALGAGLLGRLPLYELGARLDLGPAQQLRMALVLLPLALGAAALQVVVAAAARNYKEAQTYLTLLAFLPAVAAMLAAVDPGLAAEPGVAAVLPLFGQLAALQSILAGDPLGRAALLPAAACVLLVVASLPVAAALLVRERGLRAA
jgi:sodium transport system permease protein